MNEAATMIILYMYAYICHTYFEMMKANGSIRNKATKNKV